MRKFHMGLITRSTLDVLEKYAGFKKAKFHDYWVHPTNDSVLHVVKHPKDKTCYEATWINVSIRTARYGIMGKRVCKPLYKTFRFNNKNQALHVLKGLAFCSFEKVRHLLPDNFTYEDLRKNNIVMNHKDGDRFNNAANNLEWVTQRDNINHAIITGMRSDCLTGWYYDVILDKEFPFFSIGSLGKKINSSHSHISRYLKSDRDFLFLHRYMLRREYEENYPVLLTKEDCWKPGIGGIYPIKVFNTETKQMKYFSSKQTALEFLNFCSPLRNNQFKHANDVINYGPYEISPINDYELIRELYYHHQSRVSNNLSKTRNKNMPLAVIVTLPDGKEMEFSSSKEAGEYFGTNKEVVKARILRYEGKWKDLHFRYVR